MTAETFDSTEPGRGSHRPHHVSIWGPIRCCHSLWHNTKFLLFCLCLAGIVQGMIFTNVVISSIEKRFGWDSTQSGVIAGSYDIGSLLAVIPITYYGGRKDASKPKYIAAGMFVIGTGSLIFASPHFITDRYIDTSAFRSASFLPINASGNHESVVVELCHSKEDEAVNEHTNKTCDTDPSLLQSANPLTNYKYVFVVAQLLHGMGASALITLGTTLLDESVTEKMSPVFIGIFESSFVLGPALGYVVGGRLLNIFTEFYLVNPGSYEDLTPSSHQWIGAWWLGFLLILTMSYCCSLLISFFPAKMMPKRSKGMPTTKKDSSDELLAMNRCDYGRLQDIPKALYKLVTNPTFMCISLGATMDAFLLAGMAAFLPKYLESQFSLTSGQAAMLVGAIVVPAGAGGTLLGGYTLKKFSLKRKGALKMYLTCQLIILPLYLGFLLHCPTQPIAGLTAPYPSSTSQAVVPLGSAYSAQCNEDCSCQAGQSFVCSLSQGLTFMSACHAGCKAQVNGTHSFFSGCSCVPDLTNHDVLGGGVVVQGACPRDCNHIYLAVIIFFQVLFTFMATMPGLVASLRSVELHQRSLALGLQTILLRGLGTVPGPILFGLLIDKTCILWGLPNSKCESLQSEGGSCRLYDNTTMSQYVLTVVMVWRAMAAIFFILALYSTKTKLKQNQENDVATSA